MVRFLSTPCAALALFLTAVQAKFARIRVYPFVSDDCNGAPIAGNYDTNMDQCLPLPYGAMSIRLMEVKFGEWTTELKKGPTGCYWYGYQENGCFERYMDVIVDPGDVLGRCITANDPSRPFHSMSYSCILPLDATPNEDKRSLPGRNGTVSFEGEGNQTSPAETNMHHEKSSEKVIKKEATPFLNKILPSTWRKESPLVNKTKVPRFWGKERPHVNDPISPWDLVKEERPLVNNVIIPRDSKETESLVKETVNKIVNETILPRDSEKRTLVDETGLPILPRDVKNERPLVNATILPRALKKETAPQMNTSNEKIAEIANIVVEHMRNQSSDWLEQPKKIESKPLYTNETRFGKAIENATSIYVNETGHVEDISYSDSDSDTDSDSDDEVDENGNKLEKRIDWWKGPHRGAWMLHPWTGSMICYMCFSKKDHLLHDFECRFGYKYPIDCGPRPDGPVYTKTFTIQPIVTMIPDPGKAAVEKRSWHKRVFFYNPWYPELTVCGKAHWEYKGQPRSEVRLSDNKRHMKKCRKDLRAENIAVYGTTATVTAATQTVSLVRHSSPRTVAADDIWSVQPEPTTVVTVTTTESPTMTPTPTPIVIQIATSEPAQEEEGTFTLATTSTSIFQYSNAERPASLFTLTVPMPQITTVRKPTLTTLVVPHTTTVEDGSASGDVVTLRFTTIFTQYPKSRH